MNCTSVWHNCRVHRHIDVPMRDGVKLATSVFLPESSGPFSTILVRTSYWRTNYAWYGSFFARKGYAFVVQDTRGRYDSPGQFYPFLDEGRDGQDTLAWLAAQPWCNGRVGMFGASYEAGTQLFIPREGPSTLTSLAPSFMTGDCWRRAYYADGAFSLALNLIWLAFEVPSRTSDSPFMAHCDMGRLFRKLPLLTLDVESAYGEISYWRDFVTHWFYDDYWRAMSIRDHYSAFTMPVLLIGGWYDYYARETLENFAALRRQTPAAVRERHRVIVGPWGHGWSGSTRMGHVDFGPSSLIDHNDMYLRWFDQTLNNATSGPFEAPVRLFVMGANVWRDEHEWPLARTHYTKFYLHSGGRANSLYGDGALNAEAPSDEPADSFTYNPDNPAPTLGGNHSVGLFWEAARSVIQPGPFDQRPIERRDDVLVFTSAPLENDLEMTGPVELVLYAATSAPDTDFVARLCEVYPDGRSINLTEGVIRARFRERQWDHPSLVTPNAVCEYRIDLQVTSNVFRKGNRIRLGLTSSCFPLWDRNPNTGHEPGLDSEMSLAHQSIRHDRHYASHLILPVIPEKA